MDSMYFSDSFLSLPSDSSFSSLYQNHQAKDLLLGSPLVGHQSGLEGQSREVEGEKSFLTVFEDRLNSSEERNQFESQNLSKGSELKRSEFNQELAAENSKRVEGVKVEDGSGKKESDEILTKISSFKKEPLLDRVVDPLEEFKFSNEGQDLIDEKGESSWIIAKGGFVDHLGGRLQLKPWQVAIFSNRWNEWEKEGLENLNDPTHKKWNEIIDSLSLSEKQRQVADIFFKRFFEKARAYMDQIKREFSLLSSLSNGTINEKLNQKLNEDLNLDLRSKNYQNLSQGAYRPEDQPKVFFHNHFSSSIEGGELKNKNPSLKEKAFMKEKQNPLIPSQVFSLEEASLGSKNRENDQKNNQVLSHTAQYGVATEDFNFERLQENSSLGTGGVKGVKEFSNQVDHIVEKIQWISEKEGEGVIKLQLKPLALGELLLQVSNINNKVHVQLLAESAEAKNLLQNSLFDLKDSLNLKQVKVDQIFIGSFSEASGGELNTNAQKENAHKSYGEGSSGFLGGYQEQQGENQQGEDFFYELDSNGLEEEGKKGSYLKAQEGKHHGTGRGFNKGNQAYRMGLNLRV